MFAKRLRATARLVVVVVIGAAACAPVSKLPDISPEAAKREREIQNEMAFRQLYKNTQRVHLIAYPILKTSADLCGETVRQAMGIFAVNKSMLKKDYQPAAEKMVGIGDRLVVIAIAPGSAAATAGFQEGDGLVSLNGWPIPTGKEAPAKLHERFKELTAKKAGLSFMVERGKETRALSLTPDAVCDYTYQATEKAEVNAFADGKGIYIEAGMIRFVQDDNELATVIGHEIAHNMMEHSTKGQGNQALGTVVDILFAGLGVNTQGAFGSLGRRAFSQEFEAEADYVGLYLTARAGFKIEDSPYFWRRMAVQYPGTIQSNHAASHPASPHRFLALETTVKEINAKQAANKPLVPEKRETPPDPPPSATPTQ